MKALVIFRLPDNKLVSKDLAKLSGIPVAGRIYLLNGQEFEAAEVVEPLVEGGGYTQILELVKREFKTDVEAAAALTGMVNLDAKLEKVKLGDEPDVVILVRLANPKAKAGKTRVQLGATSFDLDVKSLLAGPALGAPTKSTRASGRRRTGKRS